jgi:hypothetical protein
MNFRHKLFQRVILERCNTYGFLSLAHIHDHCNTTYSLSEIKRCAHRIESLLLLTGLIERWIYGMSTVTQWSYI